MYQKICCQAIFITHVTTLVVRRKVVLVSFTKTLCLWKSEVTSHLTDECIVAELQFGRNKIFFTVLYRNPIHKVASPEFSAFILKIVGYKTILCYLYR